MRAYLATVSRVLPDRHGVQVRFNDGVHAMDTGDDRTFFVRVLARRAHPQGGAEIELPEVGETGLVIELPNLIQVWIGSIHWQDLNQVDPSPHLAMQRHESGVRRQVRANGDLQFDHPSGLRVTVASKPGALSDLQRKGQAGPVPPKSDCVVEIAHPAGLAATVDKDGALTLDFPAGGALAVDKDGKLTIQGFASVQLQDANARFCMEDLYTWVKGHVHTSAASGSPTSPPTTQPPASSLSPSTFQGPHA